ncbi:MAG: tryptophan--tRNA ligase [Candidatus Gracilibacteria bacterium]|nr:tryptophan--tRNA ligase [Candidatus Gracilibacteria bacterium]
MKKVITGIKPTGNGMHIGNYLGAFKPFLEIAQGKDAYIFIADYHSLTSVHDGSVLKENRTRLIAEYFALLPENSDITIFEQSKVQRINDISWVLSSVTPYSLMLRAHSFKDAQNKNSEINMATFNYPILMTADIITYDIDLVPVGKDQKQHLEFSRDIAGFINKTYKTDIFKLPEPVISEELMTIPGTDGRKMSKSYDNFIGIFDSEKILKKKIMSIVTDDKGLEEPKDPETCNVFALIKFFASTEKQKEIASKYLAGNYGYGHAKLELLSIILEYFKEARFRFDTYMTNPQLLQERLKIGNEKANILADKKYKELMTLTGLE